jgi:hypothetical protein
MRRIYVDSVAAHLQALERRLPDHQAAKVASGITMMAFHRGRNSSGMPLETLTPTNNR